MTHRIETLADGANPTLSTTLPREVHAALTRLGMKHNISKSAYVRKLVMDHVENQSKQQEAPCD